MLNLFQVIGKIYTSPNVDFVNDIDESLSPVVINLMLSYNYKLAYTTSKLDKYTFTLGIREFCMMAWANIQPKYTQAPFVKKIKTLDEEVNRYKFLLDKIQTKLEISNNDWKDCLPYFIEDIKKKTKEYLVLYGIAKKEWTKLGIDFEESKQMKKVDIKSGLDKWC